MFAEERKQKIVDYINSHQKATVPELCEKFNVSSATIRNDLRDLEALGTLMRTHGGAIKKKLKTGYESHISERTEINRESKQAIAELAIQCVEDGDTIILDTGTTLFELARLLHTKRDLTVVTNDLKIAILLEDIEDCTTVVLGGIVRKHYHSTVGSTPMEFLDDFVVDKAFLGTNSFTIKKGATTPDLMTAQIKKKMISISGRVYLLCDHTKFSRSSFAQFAKSDDIDVIITDDIDENKHRELVDNGFDVLSKQLKEERDK